MCHVRQLVNRELFALLLAGWAAMFPVIATAQAQRDHGEPPSLRLAGELDPDRTTGDGALAAPADAGPLLLAQAPSPSAPDAVASAAAPRSGRGESALISVAPTQVMPDDPAPAPAAALIVAQSAPPAAERPIAPGTGFKLWKIAPIRWGGNLAMDLRGVSAQGQPRQVQLAESANLRAASFIWQPWFAQVSGEMTLLATQQRQGQGSQGVSAASGSGIKFTSLTGGAQLALFPVSRFPFTASFSQTDNRAGGELTYNQYTSRRYDLTQSYAPPQGGSNYRLSYNPVIKSLRINLECPEPLAKVQVYKVNGEEHYSAILGSTAKLYEPGYENLMKAEKKLNYNLPLLAISIGQIDGDAPTALASFIKLMDGDLRKQISEIFLPKDLPP